ncbi:hypothetical protein EDD18DRAFT_1362324 [Armillaria luteobubalina]|uniref:Uncharacterized protein n=1 Tax=Armillaria luteobubalina TaxID=153913 RepID=A0AA39PES9_9AGAR|nr:hypothetical protein EDD18DRAFT_1362324 [Armillaria luteobubalina]
MSHLLTICIDLPFPDPMENAYPGAHLGIIIDHASRWDTVQLDMTSIQLRKFLDMIREPLSCVRILELSVIEDADHTQSSILFEPVFSLAPIVHSVMYGISMSTFPLSLSNLTTLCCDQNEPPELLHILEQATELKSLRIIPEPSTHPGNPLTSHKPIVNHPILRRLTIFIHRPQRYIPPAIPVIIDSICLSGLRELELVMHDMPGIAFMPLFGSEDMTRIYNLLRRSGCALDILHIYSPLPWSNLLPTILMQAQSLTTLHLSINTATTLPVFHALSVKRNLSGGSAVIGTVQLPNLQHSTFSEEPSTGTDVGIMKSIGVLYDAILSCREYPGIKRLKSLTLIIVGKLLEALRNNPATGFGLLHLIGLKSSGLNVKFLVDGDDVLEADGWLELLGQ